MFFVSGCSGIRLQTYCRIRHFSLAERNTLEHKTQFCAIGVFRSQSPRALINAACNNYCSAYAFHLGPIRPFFMPVSGILFSLTTDCLFLDLIWYSRSNIFQISAIWRSYQIPFSRQIHFHPCLYPLVIHQYFHAFPAVKSCINP